MTREQVEREARKLLGPRAVCITPSGVCAIGVRGPGCGVAMMRGAVFVKARGTTWSEALTRLKALIAELDKPKETP